MQTAVPDSVREKYFIAGPGDGACYLLGLLTAVEINDLHMLEFLAAFRAELNTSRAAFSLPGWALLKLVLASLEEVFHGCDDPAKAVMLEASHADRVTLHLELMRSTLRIDGG